MTKLLPQPYMTISVHVWKGHKKQTAREGIGSGDIVLTRAEAVALGALAQSFNVPLADALLSAARRLKEEEDGANA